MIFRKNAGGHLVEIGDKVVLIKFNYDQFIICWIYENNVVEIKSLITGEFRPIHISEIELLKK
jgi:hypothetical protein